MKRFVTNHASKLFALGMVAALSGWLISGATTPEQASGGLTEVAERSFEPPRVRTRQFSAEPVSRPIIISGRTEPARAVDLRAELNGRIAALEVERGERLVAGAVIARLDLRDREARLAEARALLRRRQLEYQAGLKLLKRKHISETQLAESKANLEAARARVKGIEVEIDNTAIRAPFTGVVDRRPVEIGDYVSTGDTIARILELDPILITGEVAQRDVEYLQLGTTGSARLATGQIVEGKLRYVTAEADAATRTFRVELEVTNPTESLMAGVTGEIRIPTRKIPAHYLSPALLALNDAGELGVKTVTAEGKVAFNPVTLIQAGTAGVWVGGLPRQATIITVGQGFVSHGQPVHAVPEHRMAAGDVPVGPLNSS